MSGNYYWDETEWQWLSNSRAEERKHEWGFICHNLKRFASTEFSGRYLAKHKKLYFDGVIDSQNLEYHGDQEFGFALPLFVLWYHPSSSDGVVQDVMNWSCNDFSAALTASKCRELIKKLWFQCMNNFESKYGMFGGREEFIVKALWGEPKIGACFDRVTEPNHPSIGTRQVLLNGPLVSELFWWGVNARLRDGTKFRHAYGQYLFHHAMAADDELEEDDLKVVRYVASNILFFEDSPHTDKTSNSAKKIRDKMLRKFKKGELQTKCHQVWSDVEQGNKNFGD